MKKIAFRPSNVLVGVILSVILISIPLLSNHSILDNDEGIYLTSLKLINTGHAAYKQTFFSQPPGFIITILPVFTLLGSSLYAARVVVGLWSLIGIIALLWIGHELKNKWIGVLSIVLLYLIPAYFNQTLVLQSDILSPSFSAISFAALLRYLHTKKIKWIAVLAIFLTLGFWTKYDLSLLPTVLVAGIYLLKKHTIVRKELLQISVLSFVTFLLVSALIVIPFGIQDVFRNSIVLRFAASSSTQQAFIFFEYLRHDVMLTWVFICTVFLLIVNVRRTNLTTVLLAIWNITLLCLFLVYKPLFPHHLSMITIPMALLFSYQLHEYFYAEKKVPQSIIYVLVGAFILSRVYSFMHASKSSLTNEQKSAISIINSITSIQDIVVTDEEILNGVSGRLPPPRLSDVSFVRIHSNNLSAQEFQTIIDRTKPKLLIPWNGRLQSIATFDNVLKSYRPFATINDKTIYIRR